MERDSIITAVDVRCYRVPTDEPEADGTLEWDATEMLLVRIRAGNTWGLGYSYTAAAPAAHLVRHLLAPVVTGQDALDLPQLWLNMNNALRNVGRPGLGSMAISAVDQALWDLKARLLDISLTTLWGSSRESIPLYGSGGFTSYSMERLENQVGGWAEQGFAAVKIKLTGNVTTDLHRVRSARAAIGKEVGLMVDANGAGSPHSALSMLDPLRESNVCWLEEPVSSDDLDGLRRLRDHAPTNMAIAAGEYGWDAAYFRRMLAAGAVDILQADATRCGYTGFLQAAQLCEAFHIPISAHCAPAIHAPACAAIPNLQHLEYFHDHVRIEAMLFNGVPTMRDGKLWLNREQPGHGLSLREEAIEQYRI